MSEIKMFFLTLAFSPSRCFSLCHSLSLCLRTAALKFLLSSSTVPSKEVSPRMYTRTNTFRLVSYECQLHQHGTTILALQTPQTRITLKIFRCQAIHTLKPGIFVYVPMSWKHVARYDEIFKVNLHTSQL